MEQPYLNSSSHLDELGGASTARPASWTPWSRGPAAGRRVGAGAGAAGGVGVLEPRAGAAAWDARRCDAERRVGPAIRAGGAAVAELQHHNIRFSSTGGATPDDPTEQKFDQLT